MDNSHRAYVNIGLKTGLCHRLLSLMGDLSVEQVQAWINSTVQIVPDGIKSGSGFLLRYVQRGTKNFMPMLITNKHVIGKTASDRRTVDYVDLSLPVWRDGSLAREWFQIELNDPNSGIKWAEHPSGDVDVLAINVMSIYSQIYQDHANHQQALALSHTIRHWDIRVGDEIRTIGFPRLTGRYPIEPVVQNGTVASSLELDYVITDGKQHQSRRGFIISAAAVPGSSGSPVVLAPIANRTVSGRQYLGQQTDPFLLGILSETNFAEVKRETFHGEGFAHVGFAFNAQTILETLQLFRFA